MKVSVIMPIYNAEKSLSRAIESILAQTLSDIEILLIDDGSTDRSSQICDNYALQDKRIQVFHKVNEGVSKARQVGLDHSHGDYVIHADSDDWIEPTMLATLYHKAIVADADVVICDYFVNINDKQIYVAQRPNSLIPRNVLRQLFSSLHGGCWNKLVKREIFSQYNISFPIGLNYCEDFLIWVQLFLHDEIKIAYMPEAFYHYEQNSDSITHAYTYKTFEMRSYFCELLEGYLTFDKYGMELRKARLDVFTEAYMRGVLSNEEAWNMLKQNWRAAFLENRNIRWYAGYVALLCKCFSLANKLLRF